MTILVRTLMFVACLLYGSMPAQSALIMSGQMGVPDFSTIQAKHITEDHSGHSDQTMDIKHAATPMTMFDSGKPCPHRGDMKHAPFCAACVIVLPEMIFITSGITMASYPKPQLGVAFLTEILTPPLPPPRA